ncbi:hypothetical protein FQR65_LT01052 [Abscondita terminalis]|nr:hypothetical protein FQR65_LT01052 [Abscondita terminalis]
MKCPEKPTIFMKPSTAYITEEQCIKIPKGFSVNQEVELGVIIGKKCRNVDESKAMDVIAGYCVALDMTATCQMKEARSKGLPWLLGKGFDTSCPVSKFIPKKCIDLNNVPLWSCVNGEVRQDGNTCDFIFSVPTLISYITRYVTLEPCDLIITGTPPGMGPVKPGDVIDAGIKEVIGFTVSVASE